MLRREHCAVRLSGAFACQPPGCARPNGVTCLTVAGFNPCTPRSARASSPDQWPGQEWISTVPRAIDGASAPPVTLPACGEC